MKDSIKELFESDNPTNHQLAYELCKGLNMNDYDIGMLIINNWLHFEKIYNSLVVMHYININGFMFRMVQYHNQREGVCINDLNHKKILPIYYYFYDSFHDSLRSYHMKRFKRVISLLIRNIFNDRIGEEW